MQYGAFLAIVALLELAAGASIYAYRTNLNEKFDHDLNQTMSVYRHDETKTIHIDTMQSTVSERIFTIYECKIATEQIISP